MARMKDPMELKGAVRLLLFAVSILLIFVGTMFAESHILVTILLVLTGGIVGLVASSGMIPNQRYRYMRRGKPTENRNYDDVPMNPWDAITSDGEEEK